MGHEYSGVYRGYYERFSFEEERQVRGEDEGCVQLEDLSEPVVQPSNATGKDQLLARYHKGPLK